MRAALLLLIAAGCAADQTASPDPEEADASILDAALIDAAPIVDAPPSPDDGGSKPVDAAPSPIVDATPKPVDAAADMAAPDAALPAPGCPAFTRPVDGCLPEDPLCWTLDDGRACLSDACPVQNICVDGDPVDTCPDDRRCEHVTRCGQAQLCALPIDCDDCDPSCAAGWRQVPRCAPNGQRCQRIAQCCDELFCEACAPNDPECFDAVDACPPFTRQVLIECPPGDPLCWTLPDGTRCLSLVCDERALRDFDCRDDEIALPDCQGREDCRPVARCGHTSGCVPDEGPDACCEALIECPAGTRQIAACAPNGRRCHELRECCGAAFYCEP